MSKRPALTTELQLVLRPDFMTALSKTVDNPSSAKIDIYGFQCDTNCIELEKSSMEIRRIEWHWVRLQLR